MNGPSHSRLTVAILIVLAGGLEACASRQTDDISPEQRLHIAGAAEASGDLNLARAMYGAAADVTNDRNMRLRAADGLARVGDPAAAMGVLTGILARSANDQDARRRLGSLLVMNGQAEEGARNLSMVLVAQPNDDATRINLGVALDIQGRHADAQPLYRAVLSHTPSDPEAANDLALSLMLSGQREAAQSVLLPFSGRPNLPERMRATMTLVNGTPAASSGGQPPTAPIPLYPRAR